ncbi:MAG: hypothetical protein L3J43_08135, partial [Sulfurovum sp.]|nr:hypothetical protein [Sulfurovum sp.]
MTCTDKNNLPQCNIYHTNLDVKHEFFTHLLSDEKHYYIFGGIEEDPSDYRTSEITIEWATVDNEKNWKSFSEKIPKLIDDSFWNKLKKSIPTPKLDLSSITEKIESIKSDLKKNKSDIDNSNLKLTQKIENIKIPNDYLKKEDFEFTINEKLKDLKDIKESSDHLETVPKKVKSIEKELKILSEKMDNLPSLNSSKTPKHIPKEEKSVIELAKYMTDGVAQFENIAKEYIS